ncbi:MAG: phosphoribosyltransferase family protein [Pseudomonadota bacterium]
MPAHLRFRSREDAGRALATELLEATAPPSVVLGVPRGGVAVAAPVAELLGAPLAAVWIRRVVSPREPSIVLAAVDIDGDVTLSTETVRAEGLRDDQVADLSFRAHQRLLADWEAAPGLDPTPLLPGTCAIVVEDWLDTGLTMRAAMRWVRHQFAGCVVLAVPVVDGRIWRRLASDADRAIALEVRQDGPIASSDIYEQYQRVPKQEVAAILERAARLVGARSLP